MFEAHAAGSKTVNVWCANHLVAVTADLERTQLVADADDHIGLLVHRSLRQRRARQFVEFIQRKRRLRLQALS